MMHRYRYPYGSIGQVARPMPRGDIVAPGFELGLRKAANRARWLSDQARQSNFSGAGRIPGRWFTLDEEGRAFELSYRKSRL